MLIKVKVEGDFVYPRCVRRKGKFICKPKGQKYKFRSYTYEWIDDKALGS